MENIKDRYHLSIMISLALLASRLTTHFCRYDLYSDNYSEIFARKLCTTTEMLENCVKSRKGVNKCFNFDGANIHHITGGMWRICGHHVGESYDSYKIMKNIK